MLGIQIGNEFLDLPPGTQLELESDNPFLQFEEEIRGSFSFPFEVLATEKNLRLLNYAGIIQQRITNTGIDAAVYQNGLQHSIGKIKIESANLNLNRISSGKISCYYLTGSASFSQDTGTKRLREIDMGGVRTFASAAFGPHVYAVMAGAPNAFDYAFYPVRNSSWGDDPLTGGEIDINVMNNIEINGGTGLPQLILCPLVPFPYLKNVLLKAVEYTGWSIEGDILNDADFAKITMINFRAIDYVTVYKVLFSYQVFYKPVVNYNLQDNLPDITINEFLIALKNRFGWWYEFDFANKKIRIKELRSLVTLSLKDMTPYASPLIPKKVRQEDRIYALRNNFITGGGEGIDLSLVAYQGAVDAVSDLPAADETQVNHVYLVEEENNYYINIQNPDTGVWAWEIHSSNIYDVEPAGSNEEVRTSATTVEMQKYNDYLDLIPRVDSEGIWTGIVGESPWGIHLCYYFGPRNNKNGDPVPFASSHVYDSNGNKLADWSLAFKGQLVDGTQVGLYDLNWKPFFDLLDSKEEFEIVLYLPMHEYLKLKFSDTILVAGVKMFISRVNAVIPYNKEIKVEAIRIL